MSAIQLAAEEPDQSPNALPIEVSKSFMTLGLDPAHRPNKREVTEAWQSLVLASPKQLEFFEDEELVTHFDAAYGVLIRWFKKNEPKSGPGGGDLQPSGVPRNPGPYAGAGSVVKALPTKTSED